MNESIAEPTRLRGLRGFRAALPAKGRAVGIHLSLSLVAFLVLLYLIVTKWYPQPYFATDGGWFGIRLMFAVDLVLGPLLTFVVFNPAKRRREIALDLSFIAAFQLAVMGWGIHTVHSQRPAAIIEWDGTFSPVIADAFAAQKIDLATLRQFDTREPPIVFQRIPEGPELIESIRLAQGGWPRSAQTFLYERFDSKLVQVFEHARQFEAKHPELSTRFAERRAKYGAEIGFLPFKGRYGNAVLVFDPRGALVDTFQY